MDEIMLMEYLKSKGMGNMSEQEFVNKFKEFMYKEGNPSHVRYHRDMEDFDYPTMDIGEVKYRRGMPMKRSQLGYYDMYAEYPEYAAHSERKYGRPYSGFNMMQNDMDEYPMHQMRGMKETKNMHFNEQYAKYLVSEMYHIENGRKHVGEKFDMMKAKEIHERYRGIIPNDVTIADVYVAINAQYHDYEELFKSWFGNNIDLKIIESAIIFWFKDSDYTKGFKLAEYFNKD